MILTPLLILLALLFAVGGRLANALQEVGDAARTSVESAVIASTASSAQAQAVAASDYEISHDDLENCTPYSVAVDTSRLRPGRPRLGPDPLRRRAPHRLGCPVSRAWSRCRATASAGIEIYREMG